MCGIAGVYVKDKYVGKFPLDHFSSGLLLGIEKRGRHASGVMSATKNGKRLMLDKAALPASEFIYHRKPIHPQSKMALLHTRLATQGPPEANENNHPVNFQTCFAVHNGVISNDNSIFTELAKEPTAEVDSLAIAALLAEADLSDIEAIKTALGKLRGSFAIAATDPIRHPGRLILAKGDSSPLVILNHPMAVIWASERAAIEETWKTLIGTCTDKQMKGGDFDPRQVGWKSLIGGDMLVLDNDRVEVSRFTVNRGYTQQRTGFQGEGWEDYYQDGYFGARSRNHGPAFNRAWTCEPANGRIADRFRECVHPCTPGCVGPRCECYTGNPNHPETGTVRRTRVSGSSVEEAYRAYRALKDQSDGVNDITLEQCWACDAYVLDNDMLDFDLHDMGMKRVCLDCAQWEDDASFAEGEMQQAPFSVDGTTVTPTKSTELTRGNEGQAACNVPDDAEKEYLRVAAEENVIHIRALRELAFESGKGLPYLDWLLFRVSLDKLDADKKLAADRDEAEYEYENAKSVVIKTVIGKIAESDRGNHTCERLGCKTRILMGWTNPHSYKRMWACKPCIEAEKAWGKLIHDGESLVREEVK